MSKQLTKSDKLGIYASVEQIALNIYELIITAALTPQQNKLPILRELRIKIEITKKLIRLMFELNIINSTKYFNLQTDLQEISKMATGWQNYLSKKELK